MLYHIFHTIEQYMHLPGARLFEFLSFRAAMAAILSLVISIIFGDLVINKLRRLQIGETVRDLGLTGQKEKQGTPTMGGILILMAILIPTLLFAKLNNIYIIIMLVATVWMGLIGFLDDYIKVFKKNKEGLKGKFKVVGQVGLGIFVGAVMYFHPDIYVKQEVSQNEATKFPVEQISTITDFEGGERYMAAIDAPITNIPFIKGNEFNYEKILTIINPDWRWLGWIIFIPAVIFIITAVSNGANLTDGIDGLATGSSAIIGVVLFVFTYVSGNIIFANYLDILYIPNAAELTIFVAAFVGACIGFLWQNSYPAKVFMGDTGSLAIGGIIATIAILTRKELLLPLLAGIFLAENLSVILQVSYFKYTKKKYGEGKRIFLMSPLHHHYQKKGYHEAKIVTRFWIIGILLAILSIVTLKIR
ncbi:MAG: phospho-N-acetylmuramoyl-pentapeptide-transferase [Bacteroidetes bacterium]|nr:phospho-N-acetylmuramoyl-pentapeptide-transferase [Bacteroidota bacterium]MCB9226263.1 phospho-N-acetylmuramoyl-pentapeptide-transferase [Chitinophagales bacterium]